MSKIAKITGQKIVNCLGDNTIEVRVELDNGLSERASVPSGAIRGKYEAVSVPDLDKAIQNIATVITENLRGRDPIDQSGVDKILIALDNTPNKSNLGANTVLGVSLAVARVASLSEGIKLYQHIANLFGRKDPIKRLPDPMLNLINGGAHADNNLSFQDFMIVPVGEGLDFASKLEKGVKVFHTLKELLHNMGQKVNVGDEGGFAPELYSNEEAMELLVSAITKSGFIPKEEIAIAIDVAADGIPDLSIATYPQMPLEYYQKIVKNYPIKILEDPYKQDDWTSWTVLNEKLGAIISIVGDDLFATNLARLGKGIETKVANSISVKPNQIGTLSETLEVIRKAQVANFEIQISHRAGETEDTFIADLAVATQAKYIKAGAPNRGERVAKYDQILRIEKELKGN